ncbi:MAG: putative aminoacid/polyamine transporter, permease protein [Hyphomicrobiales bacterium]|nr:putative aminoacid/polyamine transporter, permease protein [Hyphomicrobiales bacterium]
MARGYGIMAMDQTKDGYQSVLSQIVGAVYGHGWLYYVTVGSVLAVLCLSANTSFVDFPRLCHLVAQDGFLPKPFAVPGRRLVYSVGILFLTVGAGGLLIVFGGITDRLIPLFAVGAFLSFTLSQTGMAMHWWRKLRDTSDAKGKQEPNGASRTKLAINGLGAAATGTALCVILAAKFMEGAWLTVAVVPCTILLLRAVRRYYDEIDRQVLQGSQRRLAIRRSNAHLVIVPIKRWDRVARKAVEYALHLSPDVTALHLTALNGPESEDKGVKLRAEWREFAECPAVRAGLPPPRLQIVHSEFRSIVAPVLRAIEDARTQDPDRPITVVLPELVEGRWWGYLMHANRERRLRTRLLRNGGHNLALSSVPWQLDQTSPEEAIALEEPAPAVADKGG